MVRDYSSDATYSWTPSSAGTYQICVRVKDSASANAYDGFYAINFSIDGQQTPQPVTISNVTANKTSPQPAGSTIVLSAEASGGTSILYQYWLFDGTLWNMVRDYSSDATYSWTPSSAGTYQICVRVKDSASANAYDGFYAIGFNIS
jgi:6,7-dimethyl-8-ribityllumazine synthase